MQKSSACPNSGRGKPYRGYLNEDRPDDLRCDFCGGLRPEVFMRRLELGNIILSPVFHRGGLNLLPREQLFVRTWGGPCFIEAYRISRKHGGWATREVKDVRFYLNHLSRDELRRFAQLLDEGRVKLDCPTAIYHPLALSEFRNPAILSPREDEAGGQTASG